MGKKKYQVFISSTYTDLKEERMAVTQTLLDNNCIPVGMEQFPSSGMSQMEYIERMLDDCDYYILILAGRYGSSDKDGIGFTEKEYDYAQSKGMPVMSFLIEDIGQLQSAKCEDTDEGRKKLDDFRRKVSSEKLVKFYNDIGTLQVAVATAINKCKEDFPAVGWVRGIVDENKSIVKSNVKLMPNQEINSAIRFQVDEKEKNESNDNAAIAKKMAALEDNFNKMIKIHVGNTAPEDKNSLWIVTD